MMTTCFWGLRELGGKRGLLFWVLVVGLMPVVLSSCGVPGGDVPPAPIGAPQRGSGDDAVGASRKATGELSKAPSGERPGLGTGWGRKVSSKMAYTRFERASSKPYGGVGMIHYNDREGVEAMTGWKEVGSSMQTAGDGLVEWGVKASSGVLRNFNSGGRRFVVGKEGQRYVLVVRNKSNSRLEMVLSVDGLDVMDGKPASVRKRGYIVDAGRTLEVKGWRTSEAAVAAFQFSGVGSSYSNLKHGETRNVGVIGLAVYTEKGVEPLTWMPQEVERRRTASPFAEAPPVGVR